MIDHQIGLRIRERRLEIGMTQRQLGVAIGVSSQRIQKYEYGANRVSAARLVQIAAALRASITFFFLSGASNVSDHAATKAQEVKQCTELLEVYERIKDEHKRCLVIDFARQLADSGAEKYTDISSQ